MKKCLFLASAILVILSSCDTGIDVDHPPKRKFYYINNSSYQIKIIATKTSVSANVLDSLIPVGDTIQYWDYTFGDAVTGPFGIPAESTSVTITFYSADNRCLEFSEPFLLPNDIRSNANYFFMGEIIENKASRCYVLTDEHFDEASPCS